MEFLRGDKFEQTIKTDRLFRESFNQFAKSDQFENKLYYDKESEQFEFNRDDRLYRSEDASAVTWIKNNRLQKKRVGKYRLLLQKTVSFQIYKVQ